MIERVEVVRGGGSALFGANAVGGTVNIITKDPVSNSFSVSTNMTCYDAKSWEQNVGANVSLVSKDNSYGIAVYENYRNRNPYDHDGDVSRSWCGTQGLCGLCGWGGSMCANRMC